MIFGLTWVLSFVAAFEATAFVWYPFVILSSLQGINGFIFFGKILQKNLNRIAALKSIWFFCLFILVPSQQTNLLKEQLMIENFYEHRS